MVLTKQMPRNFWTFHAHSHEGLLPIEQPKCSGLAQSRFWSRNKQDHISGHLLPKPTFPHGNVSPSDILNPLAFGKEIMGKSRGTCRELSRPSGRPGRYPLHRPRPLWLWRGGQPPLAPPCWAQGWAVSIYRKFNTIVLPDFVRMAGGAPAPGPGSSSSLFLLRASTGRHPAPKAANLANSSLSCNHLSI